MIWNKTKLFLPVILGAIGGFLYYTFVGCNGSCAITGSPVNMPATMPIGEDVITVRRMLHATAIMVPAAV